MHANHRILLDHVWLIGRLLSSRIGRLRVPSCDCIRISAINNGMDPASV